jgi:hypothetical protein
MQHKITDRQLLALTAIYFGQSGIEEPSGIYSPEHPDPEKAGKPYWRRRTSMGGALRRMMDALRDGGFVSDPSIYERRQKKPYADGYGLLTVKGFEALEERLEKLPVVKDYGGQVIYRFEIDAQELAAKKQARADREAEMDRLRKEELEREREERAQARIAREAQNLAKLRDLFKTEGLADNWDDARLLAFADRIASVV